ncbi:hypothetical protein COP2_017215 [Malus domestica]
MFSNFMILVLLPNLKINLSTLSRPDIAYVVNQVCQFMHAPRMTHLQSAKRILRYVKGTLSHGLLFHKAPHFNPYGFSDFDCAGSFDVHRSTTGACIFLGPNLLTWTAKKQSTVSKSSMKTEYHALVTTTAEIRWFCYLFRELGITLRVPPCIFVDNMSALHIATNPIFHAKTRHIEIDYHFVRELLNFGVLHTRYIPSAHQLANIFTKGLTRERFHSLVPKLKLHYVSSPLGGNEKHKPSTTSSSQSSLEIRQTQESPPSQESG